MKYIVIVDFTDLQDNNRKYKAGELFPRDGLTVSKKRLDELLTDKNRRGYPMIEQIVEEEATKEESAEGVPEIEEEKSEAEEEVTTEAKEEVAEEAVVEDVPEEKPAKKGKKKKDAE